MYNQRCLAQAPAAPWEHARVNSLPSGRNIKMLTSDFIENWKVHVASRKKLASKSKVYLCTRTSGRSAWFITDQNSGWNNLPGCPRVTELTHPLYKHLKAFAPPWIRSAVFDGAQVDVRRDPLHKIRFLVQMEILHVLRRKKKLVSSPRAARVQCIRAWWEGRIAEEFDMDLGVYEWEFWQGMCPRIWATKIRATATQARDVIYTRPESSSSGW